MMKNSAALIILSTLLIFSLVSCDPPTSSGLEAKCNPEVPKLADCLAYASGKSDAPTSTCCGSVSEIKDKNAVCLCYLIQQAHGGGSAAVSLGLQLDKLMQLPAACKLANASVSNCPKLLNLPANSPDNAIFTTNTTKAGATPAGSSSGSSSADSNQPSRGFVNKVHYGSIFAVAMIFVLSITIF